MQGGADRFGFGATLEEGNRLPGGHLQDIVDRLATVSDRKDPLLIALPLALRATEEEIAQELHFDLLKSKSRATVAATLSRVKGEGRGAHAGLDRFVLQAEEFADRVEDPEIDGRGGSGSAGEGRLVNQHHIGKLISPFDRATATGCLALFGRCRGEISVEDIAD